MDLPDPRFEIRPASFCIADPELFLSSLRNIAERYATTVICFNADMLVGRQHAEAAIRHALRSFHGGTPIANSLEMEALLYAAGNRQCSVASSFGVHTGTNRVYICCCPPSDGIWDALVPLVQFAGEGWEDVDPEKRQRLKVLFSISDDELAASGEPRFAELVLERVSLLEVYR